MDLTPDEQYLITEFRKLSPASRDELMAFAVSLIHWAGSEGIPGLGAASNQCPLKGSEQRPGTDKTPIFTE